MQSNVAVSNSNFKEELHPKVFNILMMGVVIGLSKVVGVETRDHRVNWVAGPETATERNELCCP